VGIVALTAVQAVNQKRVELEQLSQHDGLSGLLNRTHWEKLVRGEFARFGRDGQPVVLVLADLDHFKRLNDTYGHAAGDEAIRRFAAALKRVLRETDFCGRYGGEEFGILLPFTSAEAAKDVIERLRGDLQVNPMMDGVAVTASYGLVELYSDIQSVEEWLRVVDKMLYQAKHQGRDCVVELKGLSNSNLASLEVLPPRRRVNQPAANPSI
jgi:diguanylate cyclase